MRTVPKNGNVKSWVLRWWESAPLPSLPCCQHPAGCSQERKQPQERQQDQPGATDPWMEPLGVIPRHGLRGSRDTPWEDHGHPVFPPLSLTQYRGCSSCQQAVLTPAMHQLWVLKWLIRVELKPEAVPSFSGKRAAHRVFFPSVWFYAPSETLLSDLAEIIQQIPAIKVGRITPIRHLFLLGHKAKKLVHTDPGRSAICPSVLENQNLKDVYGTSLLSALPNSPASSRTCFQ